jgi:hypothetical protein
MGIKKKNVIGCFLGQDLSRIRIATTIFERAVKVLLPENGGKFTKEEDACILKVVKSKGALKESWSMLAVQLNRNSEVISSRYRNALRNLNYISGRWTLEEEEICIETLFTGKTSDRSVIESVSQTDLQAVADQIDRQVSLVNKHWEGRLKPVLLSYHLDETFRNFRPPVLTYLVEKKVVAFQDIIWSEVIEQFPSQTTLSLTFEIHNQLVSIDERNPHEVHLPIFEKLQKNYYLWKDEELSEKQKSYRSKIIEIYDRVRRLTGNKQRR